MPFDLDTATREIWAAFAVLWLLFALFTKPTIRRQSFLSRLVQFLLFASACILIFPREMISRDWNTVLVPQSYAEAPFGFFLLLAGLLFATWARVTLGGNWSSSVTLKHNHTLVRRGPYRIVRHPIYSGILLALLGTAIAYGFVRAFVGVILAGIGLNLKAKAEEALMLEHFGVQYVEYRRQVKALIPFLW